MYTKTKELLENEEIEYFGSEDLFLEEQIRIQQLLNCYHDEDRITDVMYMLLKEKNIKSEPYRTQIAISNFLLIDILNLFIDSKKEVIKRDEINNIDNEYNKEKVKTHLLYLKSLSLGTSTFNEDKINKKLKLNDSSTDKHKRDLISKGLKYLASYNLVELLEDKEHIYNKYKFNLSKWFSFQRYSLYEMKDTNILDEIIPLLISFLKFNAPNRVDDFLNHIDKIVEYLFIAPKNYSKIANLENYIIKENIKENEITFETFDDDTIKKLDNKSIFKNVTIIQIIFDTSGEKILKFQDKDIIYEIPIKKIYRIETPKNEENSVLIESENRNVIYNDFYADDIVNKNYPQKKDTHNVLLEADTNLINYFEIKPLSNQKIYKTEIEKFELFRADELSQYKNKIYITATDTIDNILTTVKRAIPHVTIKEPQTLQKQLYKELKIYMDS